VPPTLHVVVVTVFVLATSIWVGGLVTLPVVAFVTSRTLSAADRVATFRGIGRLYGPVGGSALIVALALGFVLARARVGDLAFWLACAVTVCVLTVTVIGVLQARAMTRLRSSARDEPATGDVTDRIARSGRRAAVLRGGIVVLTLALVVLGSTLTLPAG
jgi:uncharacterized membrane protein